MPGGRRPESRSSEHRRLRAIPSDLKDNSLRRAENQENALTSPALSAADISPPSGMSPGRIEHFNRAVDWIVAVNVAKISDRMAVITLATIWADLCHTNYLIEQDGTVLQIEDRLGNLRKYAHPMLAERGRLRAQFRALLSEFGLTPNARRLMAQADPKKEEDAEDAEWASLISG